MHSLLKEFNIYNSDIKISFNRVNNRAQENIEIAYGCLPGISGVIGFGKIIESLAQAGN